MWPIALLAALATLCSWFAGPVWASGPGEPFPMRCWWIIIVLVVIIIVLLGLLLKERAKNRNR